MMFHSFFTALLLTGGLVGCVSTEREKQMRSDIFALQTKMVEMERMVEERGRLSEDTMGKRLAATSNQVDKLSGDFARVKGEIDALKVGVVTGQMPGVEGEPEANSSVAQQIKLLSERLEQIDKQQQEILARPSPKEKNPATGSVSIAKKSSEKAATAKDVLKAFEKKRFKQVIEMAPAALKGLKGAELQELTFAFAESLFRTNQHRESALKYNDFIDLKPEASKIPYAKMRMGDCFRSLGDQATAKLYYQEILDKHPDSLEAVKAREKLQASSSKKGAMKKNGSFHQGPVHARSTKPERPG